MTGIENILKEKQVFVGKTQGDSMNPMLVQGRDTVVIVPPVFPLKKYDIPVYRNGGHYTMHRVIKVTKKGYIICGDNRTYLETDIKDGDIIGVLKGFYKDGEYIDCSDDICVKYAKHACRTLPLRRIRRAFKHIFEKIVILSF